MGENTYFALQITELDNESWSVDKNMKFRLN